LQKYDKLLKSKISHQQNISSKKLQVLTKIQIAHKRWTKALAVCLKTLNQHTVAIWLRFKIYQKRRCLDIFSLRKSNGRFLLIHRTKTDD